MEKFFRNFSLRLNAPWHENQQSILMEPVSTALGRPKRDWKSWQKITKKKNKQTGT